MGSGQTREEDRPPNVPVRIERQQWPQTISRMWLEPVIAYVGVNVDITQITAFTALDDLSQLAVGFGNGSVTVIRGDLIHDRGAKQRIVHDSEEPITGLEFSVDTSVTTLYVATVSRILKLVISGRGQGQPARNLEDSGCAAGCMTVDKRTGDIVVVRDDAIYYYGPDGRGPCFGFDGPKSMVKIFNGYLALVCPPTQNSTTPKSNTLRRFGGAQAEDIFNASTFTLLDTATKFVAHSESVISPVKALFKVWGDLFMLTQDGKVGSRSEEGRRLGNDKPSFNGTMKSPSNKDLRFCISEISFPWPSTLPIRLEWMRTRKLLFTANMVTTCTKRENMMEPCNSI